MSDHLAKSAVSEAARVLSCSGVFVFSPRQLFYELIRAQAWPAAEGRPRDALVAFRRALGEFQTTHGRVNGLLSARAARLAARDATTVDVNDFSVRRVLVLDRVETFLIFVQNGFHRRIEIALFAYPTFPDHVYARLRGQLERGLRTAFYILHDATERGRRMRTRVERTLRGFGEPRFAEVGLTFAQAFRAGIPVRKGDRPRGRSKNAEIDSADAEESLLALSGSYAHVEALPPLELMRWTYERISRGSDDLGFG